MNPITNEMVYFSLFYYALGFATLAIAGFKKPMILWIVGYGLFVGIIVWFTEAKWFLMGAIAFMLLNQFYAAWNIRRRANQCIAHIKEANDVKKRENNHDRN